jgi:outer membrane protein assembly factor BamB
MLKTKEFKRFGYHWFVFCILVSISICIILDANEKEFIYFNTEDVGQPDQQVPLIQPWKIVRLDPDYGGQWILAADLNVDGAVDILSSENFNKDDVHYTTTAVAQNLDGSVIWKWGNPDIGRKNWHHDVACQIHDWNGDNKYEVIICTKGFLIELDGATGREIRLIPIPDDATDCLVFCNLSGNNRPTDVLVKDRYHNIWAYNQQGKLLWTVRDPGGFRTAHQPRPIDLDWDGRDEIMAGYAMLNSDGSVRWIYKSNQVDQAKGHLDCARVFRQGSTPEDFRIVLTCCGANNIALIDGNGKVLWEVSGHHFESIDVGRIIPNHAGPHICVDIDHQPYGKSPVWVLDERGQPLGQLVTDYSRHHCLLDFTGDGIEEILVAHKVGLYDHQGKRIGTFNTPGTEKNEGKIKYEKSMLIADITGDGILDVILATPYNVYIYKNTKGKKTGKPTRLGTEPNFTLY